jgi:copper chaperone CopZ
MAIPTWPQGSRSEVNISGPHLADDKHVENDWKPSVPAGIEDHDTGPFRVTLSVGGMTCSSCSGTITKMVSDLQGISEVAVSLLSKSATVIIDHKRLVQDVVRAVEDCGFEAEVMDVAHLDSLGERSAGGSRKVTLTVDGMFCQ